MPSGFYRQLVKELRRNGFRYLRNGKGSHEIWVNDADGISVTVAPNSKSRHTANETLKQAGLAKRF